MNDGSSTLDRRAAMPRRTYLLIVLTFLFLVVSCVSPPATPSASATLAAATTAPTNAPTAPLTTAPTPTASPSPTPDVIADDAMRLLRLRDDDQVTGNEQHLAALLDSGASDAFRGREIGLLRAMRERGGAAPLRTFLRRANVLGPTDESYQAVEVTEQDDQGRTRRVRYFLNLACCTRLTEPRTDQLEQWAGPVRRRAGEGYSIAYRDIDADQAAAADAYAKAALALLVAQLGDAYRPTRPITITLAPATIAELPAQASGYTNGTQITLLSSVSEVVASGPGSDWARTVVVHEIAHVLLFARGDAPWGLAEGIPLWLTDDRRRPELDRIVKANAVWDLAHLLEGPRTDAEFYAGYAQASSFVRFLADRYGAQAVLALWEARPTSRTLDQAFRNALGVASAEAYAAWRATLRPPAAWRPSLRPPAASRPSLRPSAACAAFAPTA